jgi:1-acyl-sn-glycerol-3-phosphate acyltransferase
MKSGCRKWIIYFMYHVCCTFYLFIAGTRTSLKFVDVDYSFYLGPNYKNNVKKIKRTSTIVCNHVSWLDPVVLIKNVRPAFAPSSEFKTVPVLSTLIDCIDSIYIPRGGSEEKKAQALAAIRDRQELIEETGKYAPFLIFAEGGTTNGTGLIKFKKGAFFAERTIRPMFMKYKYHTVNPAFDTMEFLPLAILHLSWACFSCEVNVMPDFQPNDYLFETHKE